MVEMNGRPSCVRSLHAESNAIDRAPWEAMLGAQLYVTVTPCYDCAKRIISAGIATVAFGEHYQSRSTHLTFGLLENAGVRLVYPPNYIAEA
jgi:dCMP deaminase